MQILFSTLFSYLLIYKEVTLFLISYFAALALPLPSNTTLLAASAFASQGYLNIYIIIFVAFLGNILGDFTGFYCSRKYGKEFLFKIGLRKIILSQKYETFERFIMNNSTVTIFVSRFIGGACPLVNIISGISKEISYVRFLSYAAFGEFIYVSSLSISGYFLGNLWQMIGESIGIVSTVVILFILLYLTSKIIRKK